MLTEKMKTFAQEYFKNGGNGTEAYLVAYDTYSRTTAQRESSLLLKRSDILEYIRALNIPNENKAISEREKKREWLWNMIENAANDSDRLRAMDILNRMDSEYMYTQTQENKNTEIQELNTDTLLKLVN